MSLAAVVYALAYACMAAGMVHLQSWAAATFFALCCLIVCLDGACDAIKASKE